MVHGLDLAPLYLKPRLHQGNMLPGNMLPWCTRGLRVTLRRRNAVCNATLLLLFIAHLSISSQYISKQSCKSISCWRPTYIEEINIKTVGDYDNDADDDNDDDVRIFLRRNATTSTSTLLIQTATCNNDRVDDGRGQIDWGRRTRSILQDIGCICGMRRVLRA